MKKFVSFAMGVFLLSAGFTGCSNDDDETIIKSETPNTRDGNETLPLIGTRWVERTSTTLRTEIYTEDGALLWSLFMLNEKGEISGQGCGPASYYSLEGNTIHYFMAFNGTKEEFNSATYTISGNLLTLTYSDGTTKAFTAEPLEEN